MTAANGLMSVCVPQASTVIPTQHILGWVGFSLACWSYFLSKGGDDEHRGATDPQVQNAMHGLRL